MIQLNKIALISLSAALLLGACSDDAQQAATPDSAPAPDMMAPDIIAPDTAPPAKYPFDITDMKWANVPGGAKVPPASLFHDKVVFVSAFQTWCPGCHSYGIPMTKLLMDKYKGNTNIIFLFLQTTFEGHAYNTFDKGLASLQQAKFGLTKPFYGHQESAAAHQSTSFMKTYKTGGTPAFVIFRKDQSVEFSGIPKGWPQLHDWVNRIDPLLKK